MSVLVVAEHHGGKWHKMSWDTLVAGQTVAALLKTELSALILGAQIEPLAAELATHRVDRVFVAEHELLSEYSSDGYTIAIQQVIGRVSPDLILFPHSYFVRDYGPKLAARLNRSFLNDVIDINVKENCIRFTRQLFQGKINADVTFSDDLPHFISIQSGAYRGDTLEPTGNFAPVEKIDVTIDPTDIRTRYGEWFRESKSKVDLSSAEIIVSVGRGIKDPKHIPIAKGLAEALGGELAASRPVCDNGWLPLERQVGSSGQTVSPKLYLAIGISGAIQHVVGMKGAEKIAAINQDAGAPIFEIADYGIIGDLFEVVPALTEAILAIKED
ncbi:MAG: electron transfer flavoprotein subunit alpha [Solibacterales bacterium]|nr:electron transfer flavoprotein subunit alpha [Bryobacterales bacterium]|tara:strand:+ start:6210 stop:7196 length:987 start_codon:yes stop_codon:yes gene_type:complete